MKELSNIEASAVSAGWLPIAIAVVKAGAYVAGAATGAIAMHYTYKALK